MLFSHTYFPLELSRRVKNFFGAFADDYDLRFRESRLRRLNLLRNAGLEESQIEMLHHEWAEAPEKLSYLDWGQLFEWSEVYHCLKLKLTVQSALKLLMHEDISPLQRAILTRLREMELDVQSLGDPSTRSLYELLKIRWFIPSWTEEADYLIERAENSKSGAEA